MDIISCIFNHVSYKFVKVFFNPIRPELFEGGSGPWRGGGGGGGVPAAYNSKPINDNEMKFGEVVHNDKLLILV